MDNQEAVVAVLLLVAQVHLLLVVGVQVALVLHLQ
tara:strand:+ start:555 stop:659 length:105 start_codon:yes stop_codon:yes gene_type:complete